MYPIFIAIGGNFKETLDVIGLIIRDLDQDARIKDLKVSNLYRSTPVSEIPQDDYINGALTFLTDQSPTELYKLTSGLEKKYGKVDKAKNEPRLIDLDIILYGDRAYRDETLEIPHPRWLQRDFVIVPMLDLTEEVEFEGKKWELTSLLRDIAPENRSIQCTL